MRIAIFDTHKFEKPVFEAENAGFGHELVFLEPRLDTTSARLAAGFPAVCSFVNDRLDESALSTLVAGGTRFVALIMALNRKTHRAYARVRELNFALDGLVGLDLHGKTVGVVGTGKIGAVFARIMLGFGCKVLAFDLELDPELAARPGLKYVDLPTLLNNSDILSLHVPLTPGTRHLIDREAIAAMKPGAMLVNTGRGALIDTKALIDALKTGQVGAAGLDVYEEEEKVFFQDLSGQVLQDDQLARLLTFPNVLVTAHQAFLTREALANIARATLANAREFERGQPLSNEVRAETHVATKG